MAVERWTVNRALASRYSRHINTGGMFPAGWGDFVYALAFDLAVEAVEVVGPAAPDPFAHGHFPSLKKGIERGWEFLREQGVLVTSLRVKVVRIDRHPPDHDLRGSTHGFKFLSDLVRQHGVQDRPVDPAWRTDTVAALLRGIREERAFDRLPILADALQDAGCDNDDLLVHCRGGYAHAGGCWVVDLLAQPVNT